MPKGQTSQGEAVTIGSGLLLIIGGLTLAVTSAVASKPDQWWIRAGVVITLAGGALLILGLASRFFCESRERGGPKLVLTFTPGDQVNRGPRSQITNSGDAIALNVASDEIRIRQYGARVERIAKIAPGETADIEFMQSLNGREIGHANHPNFVLDYGIREEARETLSADAKIVDKLDDWRFPIRLTSSDPSGSAFENSGELHWSCLRHRGYVKPLAAPRRWWQLLWATGSGH